MLKLFISYNHADEKYISRFLTAITPLTGEDGVIECWYDRDIKSGDDFWDEIDRHLLDRDIVCLFLSQDYLASKSCREEMRRAMEMKKQRGILIIPVVLRPCQWLDYKELSSILAATTDGKPISKFEDEDDAWMEVYTHIKKAVMYYKKLKEVCFTQVFSEFLDDATILTKAHSMKNELKLQDIFIYPELIILDNKENNKRVSAEDVIGEFCQGSNIAIVGDDQSGKTSLLKVYVQRLKEKGFLPVYVKDPQELLQGNLEYRIDRLIKEQYTANDGLEDFDHQIIVPMIDDFHKAKDKVKVLERLRRFYNCILVVDDIFSLDVRQELLISNYAKYKIKEMKPSLRNDLIKKWICIREAKADDVKFLNEDLDVLDETTRVVNASLGKMFGSGIMPAYPFFILNFLSVYEDGEKSLDQNITSQGYCYQALIYIFLRKQGINNDQVDLYINFLTEFANRIYENKGTDLTKDEFDEFVTWYGIHFNLTEPKDRLVSKLSKSSIIGISSLNNYNFAYPYLYYFFAGKYFAQQWDDHLAKNNDKIKKEVCVILNNLHKSENAYIAIFIAHHTKATSLIEAIMKEVKGVFQKYQPATLDEQSLSVFQKQNVKMATPALSADYSPEKNRRERLVEQDEAEEASEKIEKEQEQRTDDFSRELRRGTKTVEVVGTIIKNRAGSFSKDQLCELFEGAMDIHLRLMSAFLELVEFLTSKENYTDFLIEKIRKERPGIDEKKLKLAAHALFWGGNVCVIIGIIMKSCSSLGSKQLINITKNVCDMRNTPVTFIQKHAILMWYTKNIQISELLKMDMILKSPIAKNIMLWIISDYCQVHRVSHSDAEQLKRIGIKYEKLLPGVDREK